MRLLVVTQSRDRTGGVEAYLESVLPALADRHEVAFFSAASTVSGRGAIALPAGVPALSLEHGSADPLRPLRAWRPDLVFAHGLEDPALEAEVLRLAPAVLVEHTYHGTCISSAKTMGFPSSRACGRALGPACLALYLPRRCGGLNPLTMVRLYRTQLQRRHTLSSVSAVVTFSRHMADEAIRNGVDPARVHVARPFVRLAATSSRQAVDRARDGRVHLLYLGRLERLKGVDRLLDALPMVATASSRSVHLVVAGDGAQRQELEARAAMLRSADARISTEFAGWQDEAGRARHLADADALVVPSLWPEPFGLVGLEAASAGVPAVAFATGGIPEWLHDDDNGCLAPSYPANARSLADAIARCVADGATLARLGAGARRAAARWTRDRHLDALDDVFSRVAPVPGVRHAS